MHGLAAGLSDPIVAVLAGAVLGVTLLALSRGSFSLVRPGSAERGAALAALALFGRLAAAALLLAAYRRVAPAGLRPFALALALSFVALYTVELVRFAGLHRYARSTRAPRIGGW